MNSVNWQQFGLRKNPYDTLPLIEGGDLPLEKAFVGRDNEKKILNSLFETNNRLCLAICGDVGVGKTSLANFHKLIWKYDKSKLLFSFRREIEASFDLLNKRNFLIEIIGSVLREIRLLNPTLLKNKVLQKLVHLVDITQTIAISAGGSAFGFGLDIGGERMNNPPLQLSNTLLEEYFLDLVQYLKRTPIKGHKYSGLIVHVNNFDIILSNTKGKEMAISFFEEMRDLLQTPDVYFLFLGPRNFFKEVICTKQRVKSIFHPTPLQIDPLSKTEIVHAFDERMKLLISDDVSSYIKPIENEAIYKLYDLYAGDIRSIMSGVLDILGQFSEKLAKSLTADEAILLLGRERWERLENIMKLTPEQKRILIHLASVETLITQKEVVAMFGKAQSNVSSYYFKPLKDHGIIEEKEKIGTTHYYGLTTDYIPLKWLIQSQDKIQESLALQSNQMQMF